MVIKDGRDEEIEALYDEQIKEIQDAIEICKQQDDPKIRKKLQTWQKADLSAMMVFLESAMWQMKLNKVHDKRMTYIEQKLLKLYGYLVEAESSNFDPKVLAAIRDDLASLKKQVEAQSQYTPILEKLKQLRDEAIERSRKRDEHVAEQNKKKVSGIYG
ncbi:MAG: hypothetical protein M1503_04005 [Thaumarchaeota archaeon]|nr:hypothetical protein [Nitrososphaerota archaeon]MCL5317417.1 hypothetical protein [Nitrososphaerota archaeon]